MAEVEVSCQVTCRKCNWNAGGTLVAGEANVLELVFAFFKECSRQHAGAKLTGELLISWKPLGSS